MTLALLLTAVSGAWATDVYVVGNGTGNWLNDAVWDPGVAGNKMTEQNGVYSITFTNVGANPELLFKFAINGTWNENFGCSSTDVNKLNKTNSNIEADGNNILFGLTEPADVTISFNLSELTYMISTNGMKVGDDTPVEWVAATKTGTFTMPGSDVVLTPIYAKAAAFATTGTEPEVKTLLPEAAEGVIAGTDASLIAEGTGIVAFAGTSTEVKQGTLMYAIGTSATEAPALTAFSATVPTAENVADDGADVYVWYYIQGADTPDGQEATEENTFNDSEICATPIEVSVLSNKFNIAFKAANANTIEGQNGKGTVTVKTGDAEAVDKTADIDDVHHRLKAVKMGSTVTITTKEGYKFRKVEVKKGVDYSFDLSTLTSNFEAMDGDILYGTTDKTVTIPNGAHVTLNGVNITATAAIVCNGNATITLAAGSENTVTSTTEYYSGIRAGGNNTTLTINGTGKLTVKGGRRGAGIGSNRRGVCGNIVIEDGEIIATTGDYGAGIGSGYHATCGNITIKGGTITATGGNCGAGIGSSFDHGICGDILISGGTITAKGGNKAAGIGTGSAQQGWPSTCGNITITDGVTKVTATKGSSAALHSIGKGENVQDLAACGTVTIGGTEGYISESPYTYDPHQQ